MKPPQKGVGSKSAFGSSKLAPIGPEYVHPRQRQAVEPGGNRSGHGAEIMPGGGDTSGDGQVGDGLASVGRDALENAVF